VATGEIGGKITFSAGSSGYDNIVDRPDLTVYSKAINDLNEYVDGAFADGLISGLEAENIQLYLNILATDKVNLDSGYTSLYGNSMLTGTARTNLYSAKSGLDAYYTNLVSYITSSIADGLITDAEKAGVDSRFASYRTALSAYAARYEEARANIENAIYQTGSDALTAALNASSEANAASGAANDRAKVFYSVSAPTSGMKTNDLWVNGSDIYRYSGAAWVKASRYDVTETVINGGLMKTADIACFPIQHFTACAGIILFIAC
jgi:hypothetical protein